MSLMNGWGRFARSRLLVFWLIPAASWAAEPVAPSSPRSASIYLPLPNQTLQGIGSFSTGVALVDLNKDKAADLILSNGNDIGPQTTTVYYNQRNAEQPFPAYPSWFPDSGVEYGTGLAVGDVNNDSSPDVAIAYPYNRYRKPGSGQVKIFLSHDGKLDDKPFFETMPDLAPTACALVDVNADGYLDLVVATYAEGAASDKGGFQRVYLNKRGRFDRAPSWISRARLHATEVIGADIDQDGWMDLAFAAESPVVFYGAAPSGTGVPLALDPGWTGKNPFLPGRSSGYGVDEGRIGTGAPLALAVSMNCQNASPCSSGYYLYQPVKGRRDQEPSWGYGSTLNASKVLLADVNNDGHLDLLASQMGVQFTTAPWLMFLGTAQGLVSQPSFTSIVSLLGQSLAVADLGNRRLEPQRERFTFSTPRAVVTLASRRIHALVQVRLNGKPISPPAYAWSPTQNWLSIAGGLQPNHVLEVDYLRSPVVDVVIANAKPTNGSMVFLSQYGAQPGGAPPPHPPQSR